MEYANTHNKSKTVLRNANGERSYEKISKIVGLHPTQVSSLLKKSAKLGLSKKNNQGFYHKNSGVLSYIPESINKIDQPKREDKSKILGNKVQKIVKKQTSFSVNLKGITSVEKMSEAYAWLYVTENTLRSMIRIALGDPSIWWNSRTTPGVKDSVKLEIQRYPYDGAKRKDELEYTHLGHLKEIIMFGKNWNDFRPYLHEQDKVKFGVIVDKAIPTRNSVGHCIPLIGNDLKEVSVRFNDILKMIK
ncbi:MAG: hypothetical protein AABW71_05135 [Nanoarchaeota archaeon]